jgi:hypothetical protein
MEERTISKAAFNQKMDEAAKHSKIRRVIQLIDNHVSWMERVFRKDYESYDDIMETLQTLRKGVVEISLEG